ncbi:Ig-like domain-containing protein [Micromonospora sp. NPDC049523]|uniref:Ig-like domain-containing protein n=1 Tax=Micromonospora sp. NPDC049523 TaxID=3155921 RepID=UPI00343AC1F7
MWRKPIAITLIATLATFSLTAPAAAAGFNEPFYGDVTGDGRSDRVTLGYQQPDRCAVIVEPGRFEGGYGVREIHTYRSPADRSGEDYCPHLGVVIDLGWDGVNEIVLSWFNGRPPGVSYGMLVLRNFQPAGGFDGLEYPNTMLLEDWNGDGHQDIYQTGDEGGGFATYINTAAGTLMPGVVRWCSGLPQYVLADFNANGITGVAIAYRSGCEDNETGVVVIRDDGSTDVLQYDPTNSNDWRVSVIYANDDNHPDVRTVDVITGRTEIFINDGLGYFTRAPVANDDSVTIRGSKRIAIPVLVNDIANTEVRMTIATPPSHGTAQVTSSGSIVYTPSPTHGSTDRFSYRLSQHDQSDTASVEIRFVE